MKLALLALLLGGCASTLSLAPRRVDLTGEVVPLPLTFVHDVPIVEVSVDHHPLGNFVLDLGASGAILSERLAKKLHAHAQHSVAELVDAAGKHSAIDRTFLRVRLATKGATFVDTNAIVVDLEPFSRAAGIPIDGILGWSVFSDVTLTIDYANRRALVSHEVLPPPDNADVLPLHELNLVPAIDLDVNRQTRRAMLDTGAMCAFSFPATWSRSLATMQPWEPGRASRNLFGITRQPVAHLASDLHIGRYAIASPIADQSPSEIARIGAMVLRAFTITFDAKHGRVRFHAPTRQIELGEWKSIGLSLEKADDGWTVYDVVPGTVTATLDVKVGDRLTAVDGVPTSSWTLEDWFAVIDKQNALDVTIERAGKSSSLSLPVFDLPRAN